jgi:Ca-activated chloride channel homolog
MKKIVAAVVIACLTLVCLSVTYAQSRRVSPNTETRDGKINKRSVQPNSTPTPQNVSSENSETQIERESNETVEVDGDIIKVETEIVNIPVKIADRKGRFIGGLTKENFKVFEDGIEQEIAYFSNEQQPFTVALVLDMSYSTTFKIAEIQSAAMAFINQLRPNDKVLIVSFDRDVHVLCDATNDKQVLQRAIKSTKIEFGTSLYDAVSLVINQKLKRINGRKAIVLFTDGVDTTSEKSRDFTNLSDALELDAIVYPIQYDTFAEVQAMKNKTIITQPKQPSPIPSGKNKSPFPFPIPTSTIGTPSSQGTTAEDYRKAGEYLGEMANRTGGRVYQADTTANLAAAFSKIASELREYYSIGYYPKEEAKNGKKHKIKVRVDQQGLIVQARDGYVIKNKNK